MKMKKRNKLQWLAFMLVAALMMTVATPRTTAWAFEDSDGLDEDLSVNTDFCGGSISGRVTVNYNGTQSSVYRGGNSFTASSKDIRINPATGLLKTSHGISLNVNPSSLSGFGGAYRIETMPMGVDIIQRGMSPEHYEIVPTYPMTFNRYQNLLNQISVTGPY